MEKINRTWIIGDTHFGHDKMIDYCGRPEGHSELILDNLKKIESGDSLIHLGDFCIGRDDFWHREFMDRLFNVKKVLVRGNHDKKSNNWYLRAGWSWVCEEFTGDYSGKRITFSHMPVPKVKNINIHGHFHNSPLLRFEGMNKEFGRLFCLENNKYEPVLLDSFLS